jgi:HEAT repeat protein
MGFDVENFGIGLLAGWGSAYVVYRLRRQISAAVTGTRRSASNVQNYATRSADSRYLHDLIELAETAHLAGRFARLSDMIVEPRFLPASELAAPPDDEEVIRDVFHVVPQVHDLPFLHAPYNLETLSIDDLATGARALALLGTPGSGRTTALMAIALHSLGRVRFLTLEDHVQKNLDAAEARLSDKERAERVKERQQIEIRAREQLSEKHGIRLGEAASAVAAARFNRYMPVYIHLANVNISAQEYGESIDPAEPLIRAAQSQVGPITARTLPRNLYQRLAEGQALLLIDGLDDLPTPEQHEKLIWLRELQNAYPDNFLIVAGTPYGCGPLLDMGLTPVFLRPWNDLGINQLISRWQANWPAIGGTRRKPAERPDAARVERASTNNRALTPVDLSLKIWATFGEDAQKSGYEGWIQAFIARHLPAKQPLDAVLPLLAKMAALQLDEGFITLERIERLIQVDTLNTAALQEDAEEQTAEAEARAPKTSAKENKAQKEEVSAQSKFLEMLRRSGLVTAYRGGRYQFRHSFIAAYLASLTLNTAESSTLVEKTQQPTWAQALAYAAGHTPMEAAVRAVLSAPADVLNNNVCEIARWLAYAPAQVSWRGPLLKHIGNLLIAPNQFPLIRERAAAALIGTRDRNILLIFRQAARNANIDVRRLACLGMGAVGSPEAVQDLVALLEDQADDVQLAATLALGAVGSDEALEALVIALTEKSEPIRQAVAETIAAIPEEGHPILYDAITHEDMLVRRAAAFGLRRVGTRWAISALYRTFLEDNQWYVRSAAQQAFSDLQKEELRGPQMYPATDAIPWLGAWAGQRGENVPAGEGAIQVLINALQEGDPQIRQLAARTLGQMGEITAARPLYQALQDRQEDVRIAAHRSLGELAMYMGKPLPAPA